MFSMLIHFHLFALFGKLPLAFLPDHRHQLSTNNAQILA
ncbi:hypothetical protein GLYMA_11G085651v4 [Glycine max]|nr:hypothetical protein GLYMA_11G085651v4 [Glycine max]KAH1158189.1 hypothetical protein GYH30_030440 [Glycine max]